MIPKRDADRLIRGWTLVGLGDKWVVRNLQTGQRVMSYENPMFERVFDTAKDALAAMPS